MVAVTSDGTKAFCSNMASGTVTVVFPRDPGRPPIVVSVGRRPEGSVFDAEERHLYVVNRESASISVIDVNALTLARTIVTPPGPVRIWLDDVGSLLVPLYHRKAIGLFDRSLVLKGTALATSSCATCVRRGCCRGPGLLWAA
jgi:YVTN family beta-propeller protein